MSFRWLMGGLSCLTILGLSNAVGQQSSPTDTETRIHYYSQKISDYPRHHLAHALLGAAYLDKARETHEPTFLDKARHNLERSLDIQSNFTALKIMAALCNFTHRFEEGLEWGGRAAEAFPADTSVTAILVEANLGLGRGLEAAKLLPAEGTEPPDFYIAAARGHWFVSQNRFNEAAGAFSTAASLARAQRARAFVLWAEVAAAGALLDSGQIDGARPHLDAASHLDPEDPFLRIHEAEWAEAQGHRGEALTIYEELLERTRDPAINALAFKLARQLGRYDSAHHHFREAEKGYLRVIEAGENYTLGALARLYADAGVNLEQALGFARRNLQYKRDTESRKTLTRLQELVGESSGPS